MTNLDELRALAASCTNCGLYQDATQTVFGAGSTTAWLVLVGEQPGDREDLAGEPFVGPAGGLLDRALADAGIARESTYVTNAVKHFKFTRQGKRRIHQRPAAGEVRACRPWLDGELTAVGPDVLVALGATAAKTLLGPSFRVTKQRGQPLEWNELLLVATVHPSAVLRAPEERRAAEFDGLVADLRVAREAGGRTPEQAPE